MKNLEEKRIVQELTKEEQINTFGGTIVYKWVMRDGKLVAIMVQK